MNESIPYPTNKNELLQIMHTVRADFAKKWQGLSEQQMTQRPGISSNWSVKDLIAHILWWEGYTIARVALLAAGEEVVPLENFDGINAQVFDIFKDLPLEHVMAEFEANLPRLEAQINLFTDEQLFDETLYKSHGRSLARYLGGNTVGHYIEHSPDLERYIAAL
jgi:hypothetical protein